MKLKGIVQLTIKDGETGKIVHQEKHENAITPALQKIFDHNMAGTVDFTKLTPIASKLLGGVCLWDGSLDENSIYLPKQTSAKLTAHAGQHTYSSASDDNTRGNPNTEAEGYGAITNGFRYVWEWSTSQGAGQITGLTLCHADVGDYYNQLHKSSGMSFCPVDDISNYIVDANDLTYNDASPSSSNLPSAVGIDKMPHIPLGFYDNDINRVVTIELVEDASGSGQGGGDWRTGHVNINICKFTGTGLWLWNEICDVEIERTISANLNWQWANHDRLGRCWYYVVYDDQENHMYFLQAITAHTPENPPSPTYSFGCSPVASSVNYIDIDLSDGTRSTGWIDLPNSAVHGDDRIVCRTPEEQYEPIQLHMINGCIIMPVYKMEWVATPTTEHPDAGYYDYVHAETMTSCGARINLRTREVLDFVDGYMAHEGDNGRSYTSCLDLGNERSMFPDAYFERRSPATTVLDNVGNSHTSNFYCDPVPRTNDLFGSDFRSNRLYVASKNDSLVQFATLYKYGTSPARIKGAILNKMYQASVFRLTRAVTKTMAQTMTVEYTILQEEASET